MYYIKVVTPLIVSILIFSLANSYFLKTSFQKKSGHLLKFDELFASALIANIFSSTLGIMLMYFKKNNPALESFFKTSFIDFVWTVASFLIIFRIQKFILDYYDPRMKAYDSIFVYKMIFMAYIKSGLAFLPILYILFFIFKIF